MRKYIKSCILHVKIYIIWLPLLSPLTFLNPLWIFKRYKWSKAQNVGINLLNWIVRGLLVIKLSRYAEFCSFLTPAPRTVVSDLADHAVLHYSQALEATQRFRKYNI